MKKISMTSLGIGLKVEPMRGATANPKVADAPLGAHAAAKELTQAPLRPSEADGIAATLAERGSRYGDFTDHAGICQDIKRSMLGRNGCATNWESLSDVQKQALDVIADKIARILSGDPNYADNWHDIQGYAKLVEDRLPKE